MHIPPIIFSLLNQCPGLHFKYGLVFDSLFKQKKIVVNIKKICPKNPKEKIGKVYFNIIIGNEWLFFPFFTKYNITTINIEVKNWGQFYDKAFIKQFAFDLGNMGGEKQVIWAFNKTRGMDDIKILKNHVIESLIKEQNIINVTLNSKKTQAGLKEIFGKEIKNTRDLCDILSDDDNFSKIFSLEKIE